MFTFFPYMFGIEYAGQEFMWPQIPMHVFGIDYKWNILGYEVARNAAGRGNHRRWTGIFYQL